jgi:two-component system sensor histidine kinase UhpB
MAVFVLVVIWLVGKALHPIALVSEGLDRLGRGDFATSLPPFNVAELKDLGRKFNSLAGSLKTMSGDNRFLIQKLISLQENERNILAHELHDELGPCLFGIKAQAACIVRPKRGTAEEGHAATILGLVDDLQRLNRRILGRLRPMALRDLGLGAAVGQLIDDWRVRAPDIEWQFRCAAFATPPDESLALTIYRVIQECLTNSARHSGASRVSVEIGNGPAERFRADGPCWPGDPPVAYVAVRDNGRGVDGANRPGFGLLGIHERVEGRGGVVRVGGDGTGAVIEAWLPLMSDAGDENGASESRAVGR